MYKMTMRIHGKELNYEKTSTALDGAFSGWESNEKNKDGKLD